MKIYEIEKIKEKWPYQNELRGVDLNQKYQPVEVYLPARFDFIGGWTDTPPYYFDNPATVINTSIDLGIGHHFLDSNMAIKIRIKPSRKFKYLYNNQEMEINDILIINSMLKFLKIQPPPITIQVSNIIPQGSGLGGSSLLISGILSAIFAYFLGTDKVKKKLNTIVDYTLAIEQIIGSGGGWQDQIGGILPGVKKIETSPNSIKKYEIETILNSDLDKYCLIIDSKITRRAAIILHSLREKYIKGDKRTLKTLKRIRENALLGWDLLLNKKFHEFGKILSDSWQEVCKVESTSRIEIVDILDRIVKKDISGIKIGGAGGGGFILLILKDQSAKQKVILKIKNKLGQKITIYAPKFTGDGLIIKQYSLAGGQKIYTVPKKSRIVIGE